MPSRPSLVSDVGGRLGVVAAPNGSSSAEIWFAWVGDHAADVDRFSRDYLSAAETAHLSEYRSRAAAERYVVTRSLVRTVLSDRLAIPPREILVSRTDTGKPVITEGVQFNLSHSGDLILLALASERAIGVDVERRRPVTKVGALSNRWLSDQERRHFDGLRALGESDSDAFLRVWSLKEAQLKALGVGISGASTANLTGVDVVPLDGLLGQLDGPHAGSGYVGAVAFA